MFSRLASHHGEHSNVAPWRSSSSQLTWGQKPPQMSMSASTGLSASSKQKSALPLLSGTVVPLALVLSVGLGKTSAAVRTEIAAFLLAWVMSNPAVFPLVLALFFTLAIPCQSQGLGRLLWGCAPWRSGHYQGWCWLAIGWLPMT